jgi:rare lipoprotein A (peptidoglycan hydrolase)
MIDLSYSAAKTLDIIRQGVATVEVSQLNFLPQALSMLPTPHTLLRVEQMYVMNSVINKLFGPEKEKKK